MEKHQDINSVIREVIELWRNENRDATDSGSDFYDLQKDPVTQLLVGAVAHQSSLLSDEANAFEQNLIDNFINLCAPAYHLQATPAVGMLQTMKKHVVGKENSQPTCLDEKFSFLVESKNETSKLVLSFMPLLNVSIYDMKVQSVTPLGNSRWHVEVAENEPIANLRGLALYLPNIPTCKRIIMHIGGTTVDICNISDFERLPFVPSFMGSVGIYKSASQMATLQNVYDRMCLCSNNYAIVDQDITSDMLMRRDGCIGMDIELVGIPDDFPLTSAHLKLNCVPVCDLSVRHTTLSQNQPIQRIDTKGTFFMALANDLQSWNNAVSVRQVGASRMTPSEWLQRMKGLMEFYDSQYAIIHNTIDPKFDNILQQFLTAIREAVKRDYPIADVLYMVLRDRTIESLDVRWMSTTGAVANGIIPETKAKSSSAELDDDATFFVSTTWGGQNPMDNRESKLEAMQYHMQTRDKIISRADIIAFCQHKLNRLFSVNLEDIKSIRVNDVLQNSSEGFFERIQIVDIHVSTSDIDYSLIETALERMIASRKAGASTIRVKIQSNG